MFSLVRFMRNRRSFYVLLVFLLLLTGYAVFSTKVSFHDSFEYITDFFIVNMSNYVDLRLPAPDMGVIIKEQYQGNIYTHQHGMA